MRNLTDPPPDQLAPPAELEHHPAAALFPLMDVDGPEFGELVADVREHGLQQPIVLHEGEILDGRNRHRTQHALTAGSHLPVSCEYWVWPYLATRPTTSTMPTPPRTLSRAPAAVLSGVERRRRCRASATSARTSARPRSR